MTKEQKEKDQKNTYGGPSLPDPYMANVCVAIGSPKFWNPFSIKYTHTMGPPKIFGVLSTPLLNSYIAPDLTLLVQKLKSSMKAGSIQYFIFVLN